MSPLIFLTKCSIASGSANARLTLARRDDSLNCSAHRQIICRVKAAAVRIPPPHADAARRRGHFSDAEAAVYDGFLMTTVCVNSGQAARMLFRNALT
jgi:hypothetical protein